MRLLQCLSLAFTLSSSFVSAIIFDAALGFNNIRVGETFSIKWGYSASTPATSIGSQVTIKLRTVTSTVTGTVYTDVSTITVIAYNGGYFNWSPELSLNNGDDYALSLDDGGGQNNSPTFKFQAASSSSTTSTATSTTSTSTSSTSSATTPSPTTSPSTNPSPTTSTSTTNPASTGPPSRGLSKGAKAGIGIGVTLGVLSLLALGFFFFWFGKRSAQRNHPQEHQDHPEQGYNSPHAGNAIYANNDNYIAPEKPELDATVAGVGVVGAGMTFEDEPLTAEEKVELERRRRAAELQNAVVAVEVGDGTARGERFELEERRRRARFEFE